MFRPGFGVFEVNARFKLQSRPVRMTDVGESPSRHHFRRGASLVEFSGGLGALRLYMGIPKDG